MSKPGNINAKTKQDFESVSRMQAAKVAASTSAVKGLLLKPLYLWYRTPLKLFRPVRVDYLATAKALRPETTNGKLFHFHSTSIGLIYNAIQEKGLSFVPKFVLQPLFFNWLVGFSLFSTYTLSYPMLYIAYNIATSKKDDSAPRPGLKILESLKESRFFEVQDYLRFAAGGIAGGVQSLVATPLDNISLRFQANDMINGKHSSYLGFVKTEFKASNIHELYKCFRLTFVKDTLGFSVFFGFYGLMLRKTREIMESNVRIQDFVYNKLSIDSDVVARKEIDIFSMKNLPGFIIQSGCTLISGATCALMYQIADYPLDQFRSKVLVNQLSDSWVLSGKYRNSRFLKKKKIKILSSPYMYTWKQICSEVLAKTPNEKANSTVTTLRALRSLYSGWLVVALRAVPATSLGLVVYEFVKDTVGIESY